MDLLVNTKGKSQHDHSKNCLELSHINLHQHPNRAKEHKLWLPVLTVTGDDSQFVCPRHRHVGVSHHHDRIQTFRQRELKKKQITLCSETFVFK